ncbi:MAG: 1-acyl-sn-glycerol-3-phosphate acyltransferase [Candidatus Cryptobacteroides sp.]
MQTRPDLAISIGEIAKEKFGKELPGFVVRFLEKFLRVNFINTFLVRGFEGAEFCSKCVEYIDISLEVEGLENLDVPEGTKLTFASNHPLGGADGVALISILAQRQKREVRLLVNDFLMYLKGLAPICLPINKVGGQSRSLPEQMRRMFASDCDILIFPSGKCSRKYDGRIQDPKWNKSFVTMSLDSGRWIVPVHFIGQNSPRFYRIDSICRKLGIKFNIAMMFLPDELYRAQHKHFKVVFGKPIPPSALDRSKSPLQLAQEIREQVYSL